MMKYHGRLLEVGWVLLNLEKNELIDRRSTRLPDSQVRISSTASISSVMRKLTTVSVIRVPMKRNKLWLRKKCRLPPTLQYWCFMIHIFFSICNKQTRRHAELTRSDRLSHCEWVQQYEERPPSSVREILQMPKVESICSFSPLKTQIYCLR